MVERGGAEQTIMVTPAATTAAPGSAKEIGFLGIRPSVEFVRQPIWSGPVAAFENVGAGRRDHRAAAASRSTTPPCPRSRAGSRDPTGRFSVVGVGVIAGEVASADAPVLNRISATLRLLASLNIALFVFNLILLLPLDGGHVVGRPVGRRASGRGRGCSSALRRGRWMPRSSCPVTFVVVILLIGMGAILILADLFNPVSIFGHDFFARVSNTALARSLWG